MQLIRGFTFQHPPLSLVPPRIRPSLAGFFLLPAECIHHAIRRMLLSLFVAGARRSLLPRDILTPQNKELVGRFRRNAAGVIKCSDLAVCRKKKLRCAPKNMLERTLGCILLNYRFSKSRWLHNVFIFLTRPNCR